MNKKMSVLEKNDSKLVFAALKELGVSQRGLSSLMDSSNAITYWACGYRLVPKTFKRFILVLRFVKDRGLMADLKDFIRKEERKNVL